MKRREKALDSKKKNDQLQTELDELNKKKKTLETTATTLLADADKKAKLAENKQDFSLLSSSNALRLKVNQISEKDLPKCIKKIDDLTMKMKS